MANESFVGKSGFAGLKGALGSDVGFGAFAGFTELSSGAGKFKAIMESIKWAAFSRAGIAGVMAVVPAFYALTYGIRKSIIESGVLQVALQRLGETKVLTTQFTTFLGSVEAARKRVGELYAFTANSKFNFGEVAGASKVLTILTNGAEGGAGSLAALGRISTATGNSLQELAVAYGRFSSQARNGEDISGTVNELKEMGVFSESTAKQLINLQHSGASSSTMMSTFRDNIAAVAAASTDTGDSIENLQDKVEKLKQTAAAGFGRAWMAQEKRDLENQAGLWIQINKFAEQFGEILEFVSGPAVTLKNSMYDIAKTDAFGDMMAGAAKMTVMLPAVAAGWWLVKNAIMAIGPSTRDASEIVKMFRSGSAVAKGVLSPVATLRGLSSGAASMAGNLEGGVPLGKFIGPKLVGPVEQTAAKGFGGLSVVLGKLAEGAVKARVLLLRLGTGVLAAAGPAILVTAVAWLGVKAWDAWRDSVARAKNAADMVKEAMGIGAAAKTEIANLKTLDDKTRVLTQARKQLNDALEAQANVRGDLNSTEDQEGAAAALVTARLRAVRDIEKSNESNLGMSAKEYDYRLRQLAVAHEIADIEYDSAISKASSAEKELIMAQRREKLMGIIANYALERKNQPQIAETDKALQAERDRRGKTYGGYADNLHSLQSREKEIRDQLTVAKSTRAYNTPALEKELSENVSQQAQTRERMAAQKNMSAKEIELEARRRELMTGQGSSESQRFAQAAADARKQPGGERLAQELELQAAKSKVVGEEAAQKELATLGIQQKEAREQTIREKRDYDTGLAVRAKMNESIALAAGGHFALAAAARTAAVKLQDANDDLNRAQQLHIEAQGDAAKEEEGRQKLKNEQAAREKQRKTETEARLTTSQRSLTEQQLELAARGIKSPGVSGPTGIAARELVFKMKDEDALMKNFEDLTNGLSDISPEQTERFASIARQKTIADIQEQTSGLPGAGAVGDSATRVGLGGGFYAGATGDPQLSATKRIGDILLKTNELLKEKGVIKIQ